MSDTYKVKSTANTDETKEVEILTEIYKYVQKDPSFLGILNRIFSQDADDAMMELSRIVD